MNKLYNLSVTTHKLVQKLAKRKGIELAIESDLSWFSKNDEYKIHHKLYGMLVLVRHEGVKLECLAIQAPQIRQILRAFEGVLGESEEYKVVKDHWSERAWQLRKAKTNYVLNKLMTKAEALCQRWLDGLNPMIDSEPEKVLEELNEVLQSKLT